MAYKAYKGDKMGSPMKQTEDRQKTLDDIIAKYQRQSTRGQKGVQTEYEGGNLTPNAAQAKMDSIGDVFKNKAQFSQDSINNAVRLDNLQIEKDEAQWKADSTRYMAGDMTPNELRRLHPGAFGDK